MVDIGNDFKCFHTHCKTAIHQFESGCRLQIKPLQNVNFCLSSRNAKIGQKGAFCKGFKKYRLAGNFNNL
jgi:hypothetical protein